MEAFHRVRRIAERQHGLITLDQALAAGLTIDQMRTLLAKGQWSAVRRGVYRIGGVPHTWEQSLAAAYLAVGEPAYASHLTASRLLGLKTPPPSGLDLLTADDRRIRLDGVRHHRTDSLWLPDLTVVRGIPTTTASRTLCDIGGMLSTRRLESAVSDAIRRGLVRLDRLRACHERLALGPGRRAHRTMASVLDRRRDDWNPGDSDWEIWVVDTLVAAGFERPVQQHHVVVGSKEYWLDIAYPAPMLDIEFDGYAAHNDIEAFHSDRARWRRLGAAGWRVIPVTSRTSEQELVDIVGAHLAVTGHKTGA